MNDVVKYIQKRFGKRPFVDPFPKSLAERIKTKTFRLFFLRFLLLELSMVFVICFHVATQCFHAIVCVTLYAQEDEQRQVKPCLYLAYLFSSFAIHFLLKSKHEVCRFDVKSKRTLSFLFGLSKLSRR